MISNIIKDSKILIGTKDWWKQQIWIIFCESLLGLLAVLGYIQGLSIFEIATGLFICFIISSFLVNVLVSSNKTSVVGIGMLVFITGFLSLFKEYNFWMLAVSTGILLAFKDAQTVYSFSSVSLRAKRNKGNIFGSMQMGQVIGMFIKSIGVFIVALMLQNFWWMSSVIIIISAVIGVFSYIDKRPKIVKQVKKVDINKNVKLITMVSGIFNIGNHVGSRLAIPLALVFLVQNWGLEENAIVIMGGVLGLIGAISALIRMYVKAESPQKMMLNGLNGAILGWLIVSGGLIVIKYPLVSSLIIFTGWVMVEIFMRFWTVGCMETLRSEAIINATSKVRAHKKALTYYAYNKNGYSGTGILITGLVNPIFAPIIISGAVIACFMIMRRGIVV